MTERIQQQCRQNALTELPATQSYILLLQIYFHSFQLKNMWPIRYVYLRNAEQEDYLRAIRKLYFYDRFRSRQICADNRGLNRNYKKALPSRSVQWLCLPQKLRLNTSLSYPASREF